MKQTFALVDPRTLIPTEETLQERLCQVRTMIVEAGAWLRPIVIADDLPIVMDGHHRLATANLLDLDHVPVVRVSYDDVRVVDWHKGELFDISNIYEAARKSCLLLAKSTRHIFPPSLCLSCDIPLSALGWKGVSTATRSTYGGGQTIVLGAA